jgi:hypothetical protein
MTDARNSVTLQSGRVYRGELFAIGEPVKRSSVADSARPTAVPARRLQTHVHIHAPALGASVRDQGPPSGASQTPRTEASAPQRGDQAPQGELICTIARHGTTNAWMARDPGGNLLQITQNGPGPYEIRRMPNNGDAHAGGPGESGTRGPLAADQRRGFASLAPTRNAADNNPASLGTLQKLLDKHYEKRD